MDSRTKRFELRLNAHEKEVLKERAAKAGVSVSDLVRLALVYSDHLTIRTIDISPLRDLCYELTKQGTNLNQFMKFLNTYGGDAYNRLAAKQLIAGHAEDLCKDRDHRQIRRAVAPLPAADCLTILLSASSSG